MLFHIEETLPSALHLPVSSEDTLHYYRYLCTHVLIANKQFLLPIDVPVQDQSQQLSIYKIFTLAIPHGNFTACYNVNTKYLRITQDGTMAVEILPHQFRICQEANGQFCTIATLFQPLANPPFCITALYAKNTASISTRCSLQIRKSLDFSIPSQLAPNFWILTTASSAAAAAITLICPGETTQFIEVKRPIHILSLPSACSATSINFHLPPHYEEPPFEVNITYGNTWKSTGMRVSYSIWLVYLQFQKDSSTATWPRAFNTSHLFHLKNLQEMQINLDTVFT